MQTKRRDVETVLIFGACLNLLLFGAPAYSESFSLTPLNRARSFPERCPSPEALSLPLCLNPVRTASADPQLDNLISRSEAFVFPQEGENESPEKKSPLFLESLKLQGYFQQETAYRVIPPTELTEVKQILQLRLDSRFNEAVKARITGRFFYDAVFDLTDHFSEEVRKEQETEAVFRETYLNVASEHWEITLGKQQIVWGEVLGLFFADIVTAKDYREFLLPSLEYIRIPPWAANLQYYGDNDALQLVWIPIPEFDRLPVPGSEFAFRPPIPQGISFTVKDEEKPAASLRNGGAGIRWSTLISGWNPTLFYLYTYDHLPAFFRSVDPGPVIVLTPKHTRINQFGYTVSKDLNGFVLNSEGVLSVGKSFSVQDLSSETGIAKKNLLEYVIGGTFSPIEETTMNLQVYQRIILAHDPSLIDQYVDTGASIWINPRIFGPSVSPELFFIYGFNRHDWMFRPKVVWTLSNSWLLTTGGDLFGGEERGLFGQFSKKGRIYTELRYNF